MFGLLSDWEDRLSTLVYQRSADFLRTWWDDVSCVKDPVIPELSLLDFDETDQPAVKFYWSDHACCIFEPKRIVVDLWDKAGRGIPSYHFPYYSEPNEEVLGLLLVYLRLWKYQGNYGFIPPIQAVTVGSATAQRYVDSVLPSTPADPTGVLPGASTGLLHGGAETPHTVVIEP